MNIEKLKKRGKIMKKLIINSLQDIILITEVPYHKPISVYRGNKLKKGNVTEKDTEYGYRYGIRSRTGIDMCGGYKTLSDLIHWHPEFQFYLEG